jgi:hypothetical protein
MSACSSGSADVDSGAPVDDPPDLTADHHDVPVFGEVCQLCLEPVRHAYVVGIHPRDERRRRQGDRFVQRCGQAFVRARYHPYPRVCREVGDGSTGAVGAAVVDDDEL